MNGSDGRYGLIAGINNLLSLGFSTVPVQIAINPGGNVWGFSPCVCGRLYIRISARNVGRDYAHEEAKYGILFIFGIFLYTEETT